MSDLIYRRTLIAQQLAAACFNLAAVAILGVYNMLSNAVEDAWASVDELIDAVKYQEPVVELARDRRVSSWLEAKEHFKRAVRGTVWLMCRSFAAARSLCVGLVKMISAIRLEDLLRTNTASVVTTCLLVSVSFFLLPEATLQREGILLNDGLSLPLRLWLLVASSFILVTFITLIIKGLGTANLRRRSYGYIATLSAVAVVGCRLLPMTADNTSLAQLGWLSVICGSLTAVSVYVLDAFVNAARARYAATELVINARAANAARLTDAKLRSTGLANPTPEEAKKITAAIKRRKFEERLGVSKN